MSIYDKSSLDDICLETGVAIIGMSGRFPNAENINQLWNAVFTNQRLSQKVDKNQLVRWHYNQDLVDHPDFVPAGGWLGDVSGFDATYFSMSPQEARITAPQFRLFTDQSARALETAGYGLPEWRPDATGVFAGSNLSTYLINNLMHSEHFAKTDPLSLAIANDKDHMANQVAYRLNLKGPAVNVQTACSTSLVAIHMACQSLLNGESDLALAGGSNVALPEQSGYLFVDGGILARDGVCRPFCAEASGTIPANGVAVVVLKRLADAIDEGDEIHAIIRGSAINNDGKEKVGYTAPSVAGQAAVISEALSMASVDPTDIGYIEAHGTGTALGDPIETHAIKEAWGNGFQQTGNALPCALGSLKGTLGHMDAAAGVGGLVKATLCLKNQAIPAMPNFSSPNPDLHLNGSRLYIPTQTQEWTTAEDSPRMAAVSSFGIGGTNAHVIVQEAPPKTARTDNPIPGTRPFILPVSGPTAQSAIAQADELAGQLGQHHQTVSFGDKPALDLVEKTLVTRREDFDHRAALVVDTQKNTCDRLARSANQHGGSSEHKAKTAFLFSGQGSQFAHMGVHLYKTEPDYREFFDICADAFVAAGSLDPRDALFQSDDVDINRTDCAQVVLFSTHYSLAKLLERFGIVPDAMLGHSIGELSAAAVSGVLSLKDAVSLVSLRGSLMNAAPQGDMMAVGLSEHDVLEQLPTDLDLAAVNAETLTVVSGPQQAMAEFRALLKSKRILTRGLSVSHAYHSRMMEKAMSPLESFSAQLTTKTPSIPYLSNVTGTWITDKEISNPAYWSQHMRQPVRFYDCVSRLLADGFTYFVECGPGEGLINMVRAQSGQRVKTSRLLTTKNNDCTDAYKTLADAWIEGHPLQLTQALSRGNMAFKGNATASLPAVPKEDVGYWINAPHENAKPIKVSTTKETPESPDNLAPRPAGLDALKKPQSRIEETLCTIWSEALGIAPIGIDDDYFLLGGTSVLAVQICSRAKAAGIEITPNQMLLAKTISELVSRVSQQSESNNIVLKEPDNTPSGISAQQLAAIVTQINN